MLADQQRHSHLPTFQEKSVRRDKDRTGSQKKEKSGDLKRRERESERDRKVDEGEDRKEGRRNKKITEDKIEENRRIIKEKTW